MHNGIKCEYAEFAYDEFAIRTSFSHKRVNKFEFMDLMTCIIFKYTWAPQTVHNTPAMNISKGYFL